MVHFLQTNNDLLPCNSFKTYHLAVTFEGPVRSVVLLSGCLHQVPRWLFLCPYPRPDPMSWLAVTGPLHSILKSNKNKDCYKT